jgi:DNA-binding NarL/FixJ family response regulator
VSATPRLLLAEADTPTRVGLRLALTRGGFGIAGEARDAASAIECACRERPDAALVAVDLPGGGIQAVRKIADRAPATRILVLTPRQDGEQLLAAVHAGAVGYLGKDVGQARLPRIVEGVLEGEVALPRRHTGHLLEDLRGRHARRARVLGRTPHVVTERQWEILELLAEGRSTAEMASRLGISEVTARRHISTVLPKLGVKDRADAVELMRGRSAE